MTTNLLGCLISAVALLLLALELWASGGAGGVWPLLPFLVATGFGNGLSYPGIIGAVLAGVRTDQAGGASGVLITVQQFASAAGVAVLGTLFFTFVGDRPTEGDFRTALGLVELISGALLVAAGALSVLLRAPAESETSGKSVELVEDVA